MSNARRHIGRHISLHIALGAFVTLVLAACGVANGGPPDLGPLELEVYNYDSTEGRPLEALILHSKVDNYDEIDNLLVTPLEANDATRLSEIPSGRWYITVIRKWRPLPDSSRIALTTAEPVLLTTGRHELLVFADFFRLMDPVRSDDATP
jgi:hypothetical protein